MRRKRPPLQELEMTDDDACSWLRSVGLMRMTTSDRSSVIAEHARISRRVAKVSGDPVERVAAVRALLTGEGFLGESMISFADQCTKQRNTAARS